VVGLLSAESFHRKRESLYRGRVALPRVEGGRGQERERKREGEKEREREGGWEGEREGGWEGRYLFPERYTSTLASGKSPR